jgi:hypothetical protein
MLSTLAAKNDEPVSKFEFSFNLRSYSEALRAHPALLALAPAAALLGRAVQVNRWNPC